MTQGGACACGQVSRVEGRKVLEPHNIANIVQAGGPSLPFLPSLPSLPPAGREEASTGAGGDGGGHGAGRRLRRSGSGTRSSSRSSSRPAPAPPPPRPPLCPRAAISSGPSVLAMRFVTGFVTGLV